jgi:aminopeptidase-like protein
MRTPHGQFPEYHTSADNLEFIVLKSLDDSFSKCLSILNVIENNAIYLNQNPKCEPQLGKRGLYSAIGGQSDGKTQELAMLWVLSFSDGKNSLLDISDRSGMPFAVIHHAAEALKRSRLIEECA